MTNEEKMAAAVALLNEIVAEEAKMDVLAAAVDVKRASLESLMIQLNAERIESNNFESLRYDETSYEVDGVALVTALNRFADKTHLDTFMPRKPAGAVIRKLIDSKEAELETLRVATRACCTKHVEWKLKVQKAKKKSKRETVTA